MNRKDVLDKIDSGHFVSVKFRKKDNSVRNLTGRLGVTKHLRGGTKKFDDGDYNLVTIYDVENKGYRSFSVDRLMEIRANGETYKFGEGNE